MGSNPVRVIFAGLAQSVERRPRKAEVAGSIPVAGIFEVLRVFLKKPKSFYERCYVNVCKAFLLVLILLILLVFLKLAQF